MAQARRNLWKPLALTLAGLLAYSWAGPVAVATAEAAKPKRLSAALAALQSSKKHLEDAKDPPATFHQKSISAVDQAIAAVEREIKAYGDTASKKERDKDRDTEVPDRNAKASDKGKPSDRPAVKRAGHSADAGDLTARRGSGVRPRRDRTPRAAAARGRLPREGAPRRSRRALSGEERSLAPSRTTAATHAGAARRGAAHDGTYLP
jgi:hypothetical protein